MGNLIEKLEDYDGTEGMVNDFLNMVKSTDRLLLFGAGVAGRKVYQFLARGGMSQR